MLSGIETYILSDEMLKKINSLTDSAKKNIVFTKEQDYIIKEYYHKKSKQELSKLLGICENTLRKRFRELETEV